MKYAPALLAAMLIVGCSKSNPTAQVQQPQADTKFQELQQQRRAVIEDYKAKGVILKLEVETKGAVSPEHQGKKYPVLYVRDQFWLLDRDTRTALVDTAMSLICELPKKDPTKLGMDAVRPSPTTIEKYILVKDEQGTLAGDYSDFYHLDTLAYENSMAFQKIRERLKESGKKFREDMDKLREKLND